MRIMMLDYEEFRAEFPILEKMAYLNIAHGNPISNSVREAMNRFIQLQQMKGIMIARPQAYGVIEEVRVKIANLINGHPHEIALVKNTSEGLNLAAHGIDFKSGDNVVLNELEHLNNTFCWLRLKKKGVEVRIVPQRNGRVEIEHIADMIDSKTKGVAIASTTNLGFRFDLEKLGDIVRDYPAYLVVDAIQSLGIEPMDVKKTGIDMLSSSAHKGLLGPHGIGFFYCSEDIIDEITPMSVARTCYENYDNPLNAKLKKTAVRFEGGNYNYIGVYGISAGLDLLHKLDLEKSRKYSFELSDRFREGLKSIGASVRDSPIEKERSHIVTFTLPGKSVGAVNQMLDERRVRVSSLYGAIRASFAPYNTINEVERALEKVKEIN